MRPSTAATRHSSPSASSRAPGLRARQSEPRSSARPVDPAAIAPRLFWGAFTNSGQVCIAIKRLYVHESVYRPVVGALAKLAREVKVGGAFEEGVEVGPINNRPQFERVADLVEDARSRGGRVAAGGAALARSGYFYPPTIVGDVGEGVRLVDEEQFGTALPILKYSRLEDAIEQANRTHYGLGGSIWTGNLTRGMELVQELECGTGWVNHHMDITPYAPFGGCKWSGLGYENGRWGYDEFTEMQVVNAKK